MVIPQLNIVKRQINDYIKLEFVEMYAIILLIEKGLYNNHNS